MKRIMDGPDHVRGMSDHAPLYALIILAGVALGLVLFIAILVWGLRHVLL